ncbi:MAG: hypothetical protein KBD65_03455 [Candidatus Moranbacteria bacterium]|nr:hypothetical protein [Candidatus Moranbacteria bacterium]
MPGYIESYVNRRIAQAYQVLLERFPEAENMAGLELIAAPRQVTESSDFRPMMTLVSSELRKLFSEESGRQLAVVLTLSSKQAQVLSTKESEDGSIQYGVDNLGPYQLFIPKKLPFRRRKSPVMTRISFEELCFRVGDAKGVYGAVYVLIAVSVDAILDENKGRGLEI